MKLNHPRTIVAIAIVVAVLVLAVLIVTAPKNPQALFRVVDASGKPIAGAIIKPRGLRVKTGTYSGAWYTWREQYQHVPTHPVTTDKNGVAILPYPFYVTEKLETGTLCLAVSHTNYVPQDPERIVSLWLPRGAPWRDRAKELWDRIRHHKLESRTDPIVMVKGATVEITITNPPPAGSGKFLQQVFSDDDAWAELANGVLLSHQVADGTHYGRVAFLQTNGTVLFTDVVKFKSAQSKTNKLTLALHSAPTVRGKLDETVPRPVNHGRVIVTIWPVGIKPDGAPPQWHAWTHINADGTFSLPCLPTGDLEIIALCDGFINTNGPGKSNFRYPQKHRLGTNDLNITIGMEPTVTLEITLHDDKGNPVTHAEAATWPNVHWGDWAATVFGSDCYNTADLKLDRQKVEQLWTKRTQDFRATSDKNGIAIISNLPPTTDALVVDHERFALPVSTTSWGEKTRNVTLQLKEHETNHISLRMVPKEQSVIAHY